MRNPLIALRKLLGEGKVTGTGRVLSIGTNTTVSMAGGVQPVSAITPVEVGDYVLVVEGVIRGKVKKPEDVPVYFL